MSLLGGGYGGGTGGGIAIGAAVAGGTPNLNLYIDSFGNIGQQDLSTIYLPLAGGTMTGGLVLNPLAQVNPNDAATLGQVLSYVAGLNWKNPAVQASTTGNINISAPASAVFDGHTVIPGESVLVQFQLSQSENGCFVFNGVGVPMTRRADADTSAELTAATFSVGNGFVYAGQAFTQTFENPVIGVDPVIFAPVGKVYVAGAGIDITGNVISIAANSIVNSMVNSAAAIDGTKISPDFGNQDVQTTGSGKFKNLSIINNAGQGFLNFTGTGSVPAGADGIRLFSPVDNQMGFINPNGAINVLDFSATLVNNSYIFPDVGGSATIAMVPASGFVTSNGSVLSSVSSISLTSSVSGILPIANGGTNNGNSYTAGSVIFSNGVKLTDSNSNFFWDDINKFLGINAAASPSTALTVGSFPAVSTYPLTGIGSIGVSLIDGSKPIGLAIENTGTQSASGGAGITLASRTGVVTAANARVGLITFVGTNNSIAQAEGARIEAVAPIAWNAISNPLNLDFYTNNGLSSQRRMSLLSSGQLYIGGSGTPVNAGTLNIEPLASVTVGMTVRGLSGQSANLFQAQSNFGANLTTISSAGVVTAPSFIANGSAGAGFLQLRDQNAVPATAAGLKLYSDNANRFNILNSAGRSSSFDASTLTTSRAYTLPDNSGTLALLSDIPAAGAPINANYVVISNDPTLTNDRALAVDQTLTLVDGGANSSVTLGATQISKRSVVQTDFLEASNLNVFAVSVAGTGASAGLAAANSVTGGSGQVALITGTTAAGRSMIGQTSVNVMILGNNVQYTYETRIQLSALSTAGDRYTMHVGWNNSLTAAGTNAVRFVYSDNLNGGSWQCITTAANVSTTTNTATAAVAGAWIKLKIVVNAAATSAQFYINGTLVATNTTNIPSTGGNITAIQNNIIKSVGTTSRTCFVDYMYLESLYNTAR